MTKFSGILKWKISTFLSQCLKMDKECLMSETLEGGVPVTVIMAHGDAAKALADHVRPFIEGLGNYEETTKMGGV